MLATKRLAGVTPVVNLSNSLHAGNEAHKQGIYPGFETQGRLHQKSKMGISGHTKFTEFPPSPPKKQIEEKINEKKID